MALRLLQIGIAFAIATTACFADTITLKSGRVLNGTYLGGSAREVRVETDPTQTVNVSRNTLVSAKQAVVAIAKAIPICNKRH